MSEFSDRFIGVVHTHTNTTSEIFVDLHNLLFTTVLGSVDNFERSRTINLEVSGSVLVTESVSSDNDRLLPLRNKSRNVLAQDGFSENGTSKIVSDGSVGRLPHLLELEFLNSGLIRSDGGTLDSDLAFLDGLSSIEGDLVVSLVSVFHTQIEVLNGEVKERENELFLNELPDNSGHFITV